MKKKILIIIAIISILIVPRGTLALTSEYESELIPSPNYKTIMEQYKNEINLINEYIENNGFNGWNIGEGKYVLLYRTQTFSETNKSVRIIDISSGGTIKNYYGENYNLYKRFEIQYSGKECNFVINNNEVSTNNCTVGTYSNYIEYPTINCNPTLNNCKIYWENLIPNTSYLTDQWDNEEYDFKIYNSNKITDIPLKIDKVIYTPPTKIEAKKVFDSMIPNSKKPVCTKTQVLGMISNPKNIEINITGKGNALNKDISGYIEIRYESNEILKTNNFNIGIEKDKEITGDYDFWCSNEDYVCNLSYAYNYMDDIETNIQIKLNITGTKMPSFVRMYNCMPDYDRGQITYDYNNNNTSGQTPIENKINETTNGIGRILNFLNPSNLIYLIIPTEQQMQSLLNEMQEKINSKMGILGIPLTIYTRIANLANTSNDSNWCISWEGVKVPNFEQNEIINGSSWCFSEILQNEKINNFREVCITIIGGIILLSFVQYLHNTFNKVIDSPDRDEYEYITTEDTYQVNDATGELQNHVWKKRKTVRQRRE